MTDILLNFIGKKLTNGGVNYEFGEWGSDPVPLYFVGEYISLPPTTEDGLHEHSFMLTGFCRGRWSELEKEREKIEGIFRDCTQVLEDGTGVDISYSGCRIIPTGTSQIKRIQIDLDIKEWKVNI